MNASFRLRPATLDDAERLFAWRNDPATRTASRNVEAVDWKTHLAWLDQSLHDPRRRLMIALSGDVAVGTIRADLSDEVWELSWTVAPECRGCGVGSAIVKLAAEHIGEAIRAEVKVENSPSARIAERAGMKFVNERSGVMHFARDALSPAKRLDTAR